MKLDSFEDIKTAVEEAEKKRSQGDLLGVYNSYWTILSHRLSTRLIEADMIVVKSLADLAVFFGDFQAADDLLTGLVGLYEEAGNLQQADFSLLKRIQLAIYQGDLRKADALFGEMASRIGDIHTIEFSTSGLVQWEASCGWPNTDVKDRAVLFSQLHLQMGKLLSALGQYGQALVTLNRGLFHAQPEDLPANEIPSLARQTAIPLKLAIASAYLEKGQITDAKSNLEILKTELDKTQQPEFYVRWLEIAGKVNLLCGEFGQALEQFKRVHEICHSLSSRRAVLQGTLNLAQVLILLNQTSLAKDYLIGAQADAQAFGEPALVSRANLLIRLAKARGQSLAMGSPVGFSVSGISQGLQDNTPDAVDDEEEHLSFINQSANYLAFFEDRALAFQWQLSRFNFVAAANLLSQIKEVFQLSDSVLIANKIKILEGMLAYYQGVENQEESTTNEGLRWAALILYEVRPSLRDLGLKPELWQVQRILGWCLSRLKRPAVEQESLAKETNNLLTELTESLSPEDQAIYLLNKWTADEEYIAAQINQLQPLREKLINGSILLRPWRRWLLMQRLNALLEHIDRYKDVLVKRTIKGRNADVENARVSSLWRRLLTHPNKRVTLSFLVLPDRVLVVRAWRFLLDFAVIDTARLEVRNTVQGWHEEIQGTQGGRTLSDSPNDDDSDEPLMTKRENECKEIANHLAEILEIPSLLEGLPKNTQALTIVPDDILHGFPFATIVHQGKYLIEHYALSIAYESSGQKSPTPPSEQVQNALIVGVSKGIMKRIRPLPGVTAEIKQVKEWLTGHGINSCTLLNNSAHKGAVIDRLSKATLLHMACHGTFEHNRPDQSGLVLIPNSEQEEILSLRELSNLDLTALHHATLSSCWSADHFILPGRWIISLPETLWRSGVQSILGCLWEVNDQVAVSFMTRFYDYLDNLPRDEALRRTQLDCLQRNLPTKYSIDTANPIYWSGFSLYGDYTRLDLQHRVRDIGSI